MDEVFKALADPTRRELLDRLRAENGQNGPPDEGRNRRRPRGVLALTTAMA